MNNTIKKYRTSLSIFSNLGALAILGFYGIATVISVVLSYFPAFSQLCRDNETFYLSFDIICSALYLFIPFLIVYLLERKISDEKIPFGWPSDGGRMCVCVFGGLALCIIGSYLTSYLVTLLEDAAGIKFIYESYDTPPDTDLSGRLMYFVRMAVFPAFVEEFAMRGVVMTPLRRYGDKFAILMSSMMFALMHGNMIQLPFAFVAGFALGYAVIQTGSLWTSIFIHLGNNMLSVLQTFMLEDLGEENIFAILTPIYAALVIGILCIVLYITRRDERVRLKLNTTGVGNAKCYARYILSPGMIISILYMIYQTILASDKGLAFFSGRS